MCVVMVVLSAMQPGQSKLSRKLCALANELGRGQGILPANLTAYLVGAAGLLSVADYNNMGQCESLDDIKLNLVSESNPHIPFLVFTVRMLGAA